MCASLTFSCTDGLEEYGITLSQTLICKKKKKNKKREAQDGSSKSTVCLNVTYTKTILTPLQSKFHVILLYTFNAQPVSA